MSERDHLIERLLMYVEDELDPAEHTELEVQLARDPKLREQLEAIRFSMEAARDWAILEVPGIERAERLRAPRLRPAAIRDITADRGAGRVRRAVWQILAAAAVFIAGFAIGSNRKAPVTSMQGQPSVAQQQHAPSTIAQPTPTSAPSAETPEPRYATDENGRVVVETVAPGSGTRATWVVDGRFQLAMSAR